jgi:hypothetical protein
MEGCRRRGGRLGRGCAASEGALALLGEGVLNETGVHCKRCTGFATASLERRGRRDSLSQQELLRGRLMTEPIIGVSSFRRLGLVGPGPKFFALASCRLGKVLAEDNPLAPSSCWEAVAQ